MRVQQILNFFKKVAKITSLNLAFSSFIVCLLAFNSIGMSPSKSFGAALFVAVLFLKLFLGNKAIKIKDEILGTQPWTLGLSALVVFFGINYLVENFDLSLKKFPDRTIGISVLQGIDIGARTNLYLAIIFISVALFLMFLYLFLYIDQLSNNLKHPELDLHKKLLFTFSLFSCFMIVFHYINGSALVVNIKDIFIFLTAITFIKMITTLYLEKQKRNLYLAKILKDYDLNVLSYLLPLVVIFLRWIFVNRSFVFNYNYFYIYGLLWILFWIFIIIFSKLINIRRLCVASIPLILIPLSIPIVNEIQYSLSSITHITLHLSAVLFSILLLFTSLLIYFLKIGMNWKFPVTNNIILPLIVATATIYSSYVSFIDLSKVDMFHHGENLIVNQQLFNFNSIPYINIYPTHGISYLFGQILFTLFNGYAPFAPWAWEWLRITFEVLLLYFLLKTLMEPIFATLVIIFMPILSLFGGQNFIYGYNTRLSSTYYFMSFLGALICSWLLSNPTRLRFLIFFLCSLFLFLWRIDFGIVAGLTSILIIFTNALFFRIKKIKFNNFFIPFVFVFSTSLLLLIFLSSLGREAFKNIILQNIKFISFQPQTQGLKIIANNLSSLTIWQYFILPLVGVFYVLYFPIQKIFYKVEKLNSVQNTLLYIAFFSLLISSRSFQRQSLATLGYNSYLFVLLFICIPIYLKGKFTEGYRAFFLTILLIYLLIFPNPTILLSTGNLVNLHDWKNKESRVRLDDSQYKTISTFLDENLEENQTFLDLTSSPLLYVTTNRKFLYYFIPNSYQTSDTIQLTTLNKIRTAYEANQIPIVIFRQSDNFANNIDGVPNELRSYLIYEYIYTRYKPVGYVDGFNIWVANNIELKYTKDIKDDLGITQNFDMQKLAYYWGTYDENEAFEKTKILHKLISEPVNMKPMDSLIINIPSVNESNYLAFSIKSQSDGQLLINYLEDSIIFDIISSSLPQKYLVRISTLYSWYDGKPKSIKITSLSNILLSELSIRKEEQ